MESTPGEASFELGHGGLSEVLEIYIYGLLESIFEPIDGLLVFPAFSSFFEFVL